MSTIVGTTLSGRYRLEARIGAGGMSTVYRAVDQTLERVVAVKLMNREIADDSDQLERFRREARAVAQLSHPHVVGVIDAGEDDQRPYIVFEYVEGETLKARIRRLGQLPVPEAVAYSIEIARALEAAHVRQIVHRDVKPQNVLIDQEGSARVTDFGIARTSDEQGLTADGRVLGTTDYVSPEQALGQEVTGQSDLYSLGIALYEMLTGEVPFRGENQVAVAMKHVREPLPDVRSLRPEISAALAAVVEKATAKRPEQRYGDDAELIADLEEVLAIETARAGSAGGEVTSVLKTLPADTQRRIPFTVRRRSMAVAVGVILALVAAGLAVWLGTRAHHGDGIRASSTNPRSQIALCESCADAYNPDGYDGDISQNNGNSSRAVDGNLKTAWTTEQYYAGTLGKAGVGLYVKVSDSAGVAARKLVIDTVTPHFDVSVYATNRSPDPTSFAASDWVKLGGADDVGDPQTIALGDGTTTYRYYLVWITHLPPDSESASLNEVALYR